MKDQGYNVTGITLKLYDDAKLLAKEDSAVQVKILLMLKSFRKNQY